MVVVVVWVELVGWGCPYLFPMLILFLVLCYHRSTQTSRSTRAVTSTKSYPREVGGCVCECARTLSEITNLIWGGIKARFFNHNKDASQLLLRYLS